MTQFEKDMAYFAGSILGGVFETISTYYDKARDCYVIDLGEEAHFYDSETGERIY